MKKRSKVVSMIIAVCMVMTMVPFMAYADTTDLSDEIVVLYSSDINGGVAENIGVAGMAAYANEMKASHKYVEVVDAGNAAGGTVLASISKGEYVIEAMNAAGYTMAVPGSKEFSYGVSTLVSDMNLAADFDYISCNFGTAGSEGQMFSPYKIKTYGDVKVAYVGISDPDIMNQHESQFRLSDGTSLYTFAEGNGGKDL